MRKSFFDDLIDMEYKINMLQVSESYLKKEKRDRKTEKINYDYINGLEKEVDRLREEVRQLHEIVGKTIDSINNIVSFLSEHFKDEI